MIAFVLLSQHKLSQSAQAGLLRGKMTGGDDSYQKYIELFIKAENRWRLDRLVDYDNSDESRDLREIARVIPQWEVTLVSPLGITDQEIHDIKDSNTNVELRRYISST